MKAFETKKYIERRKQLCSLVKEGYIILLGNSETPMNYKANTYKFRQDSTFLYFTGLNIPNLHLIIDANTGKSTLYGNNLTEEEIVWMGYQPTIADLASMAGIENAQPLNEFYKFITFIQEKKFNYHILPPYRDDHKILLHELFNVPIANINSLVSEPLIKGIVTLRSVKDDDEIQHLDEIMNYAYKMHITAMQMAHEGVKEQHIAGVIEGIALSYGNGVSFPIILSKHSEILHNHDHSNVLKKGDLMICDAGFESELGYSTDHTRTYAVDGEFSDVQKEIYTIVLNAQKKAISLIKPNILFRDIHLEACKIITEGLKSIGLLKGDTDEIVKAGAHTLFFPHGLGHMLGLDVHDMENLGEKYVGYDETVERSSEFGLAFLRFAKALKPGYVLTVEPGIYFIPPLIRKWQADKKFCEYINYSEVEKFINFGGIRLEEDILVTENGCRLLGKKQIPIEIQDVINTIKQ
ncbi:MAG: aminopeptidase P family protein [Bacteroidales bacterium]|nr:aminopeptidase P family protein [Bacteroidales bacterium]